MLKLIRNTRRGHGHISRFNTSHVKVNPKDIIDKGLEEGRFNTSHVKVNPYDYHIMCALSWSFNTSHVKVNQSQSPHGICNKLVSIHPMLKLIQRISCIPYNTLYQISQYLSRFLKFLPATAPFAKKFTKSPQCHCFCGFTQFYTDWRLVNFHCITKSTAHHFPYPSFQAPPRQTHFH